MIGTISFILKGVFGLYVIYLTLFTSSGQLLVSVNKEKYGKEDYWLRFFYCNAPILFILWAVSLLFDRLYLRKEKNQEGKIIEGLKDELQLANNRIKALEIQIEANEKSFDSKLEAIEKSFEAKFEAQKTIIKAHENHLVHKIIDHENKMEQKRQNRHNEVMSEKRSVKNLLIRNLHKPVKKNKGGIIKKTVVN